MSSNLRSQRTWAHCCQHVARRDCLPLALRADARSRRRSAEDGVEEAEEENEREGGACRSGIGAITVSYANKSYSLDLQIALTLWLSSSGADVSASEHAHNACTPAAVFRVRGACSHWQAVVHVASSIQRCCTMAVRVWHCVRSGHCAFCQYGRLCEKH